MKYKLKQGIDRKKMRGHRIGDFDTLPDAINALKAIRTTKEPISKKPELYMDSGGPFLIMFIQVHWDITYVFYGNKEDEPTITFQDFITKYFEPCSDSKTK